MIKDPNRYPRGFNREKVRAIIDYYESQSESEAIAEGEAAFYRKPMPLQTKNGKTGATVGTKLIKAQPNKRIRLKRPPARSFLLPNQWRLRA